MCRRGHHDAWMRTRPTGSRYCRRCATIQQLRRNHGQGPLPRLPAQRLALDRAAFADACARLGKSRTLLMELAGISRNCMGTLYQRGGGPKWRAALCETLNVKHDELWRINR